MIFILLFFTFFKIGAFTFGGGYAMLPLVQAEVLSHNWMQEEEIINFIAISESTPGPFAVNAATYVGFELAGVLGALCATLGVVTPSFLIILLIAKFFARMSDNKIVKGCMTGLKAAVVGLIGAAVISTGKIVFAFDGAIDRTYVISIILFVYIFALSMKKVHPILLIITSAIVGIILL